MSERVSAARAENADREARSRAIDVTRSFIVQAPAGSGKTELLIQRYLALLAGVEAPEEVIAITFTRKAAAEMRSRVLAALAAGANDTPPEAAHALVTWRLARAVRARDEALGWELAANPNRLRIDTIDALCHALARQMPVLSRLGARPETVLDARALYEDAARRTLALLDAKNDAARHVASLLPHLDNNVGQAIDLIAGMLARRDQWIRHVAGRLSPDERRAQLEAALAHEIEQALERLVELIPAALGDELAALLRHACANLAAAGIASPMRACEGLDELPGADAASLEAWRGVAELALIKAGAVRTQVNKNTGFPPGVGKDKAAATAAKARHAELMAALAPHRTFIETLHFTRALPPATYTDAQWRVVEALAALLPLAAANLELIFGERGQADFTAVSQAALRALGDEDAPTDLALSLDYRIRHLLVDEFQDTSLSQYELLKKLTAGWQPDDGRTLFVVGDPMQSIYRFREAEVGLYLRARSEGIGTVSLTPLTLSVNFRSQRGVVEWVNRAFAAVMPDAEDLASGAVPYVPCVPCVPCVPAHHEDSEDDAVHIHALGSHDRDLEARRVAEIVQWEKSENPNKNIVLLVRARGHLRFIAQALRDAGYTFQAVEIEPLGERAVVRDLTALTRALFHPADRIAWLAVLRAPWCGLTLADLTALAGDDHRASVWILMHDEARVQTLSADGVQRLTRVRGILAAFIAARRRASAARWIEGAWLALGGPACVTARADLEDAQAYFRLLETLEEGGDIADFGALEENVARLFAAADAQADARLQLMTIHKAKGLEFDVVIVPGLGYTPRRNEPQLLAWQERPRAHGESELLLAPIREASEDDDPIYRYLDALEKLKGEHEDARLLYVAATRAKSRLHLIAQIDASAEEPGPRAGSLLARLWPAVAQDFAGVQIPEHASPAEDAPPAPQCIHRLPLDWMPPPAPARVALALPAQDAAHASAHDQVEFSWASETAKHIGTVVHRFLQRIAEEGVAAWDAARVQALNAVYQRELKRLGVPATEMDHATTRVSAALTASVNDARGRWMLDAHAHVDARAELRLTGRITDSAGETTETIDVVIDRTFIDDNGVRWIIDFKTSVHEGADRDAFLDNERVRYAAQLQRYGALMRMAEDREIRLGLYFPLLGGWREWRYEGAEG
jgi:ATP-dependent helicase/nuclease subunit A